MISRVVKRRELSHGIRRKSRATWFPADTKVRPLGSLWVFASAETTLNHAWNQQQQNLNFQPKVGSSWWLRLNQPHLAKICNKVKLDRIISKESSGWKFQKRWRNHQLVEVGSWKTFIGGKKLFSFTVKPRWMPWPKTTKHNGKRVAVPVEWVVDVWLEKNAESTNGWMFFCVCSKDM